MVLRGCTKSRSSSWPAPRLQEPAICPALLAAAAHAGQQAPCPPGPEGTRERNCDPERKIMMGPEANKSKNARADPSQPCGGKRRAARPMSQPARTRTSRPFEIPFLAHLGAHWPGSQRCQKVCPCVQINRPDRSSVWTQVAPAPHACDVPRHVVESEGSSVLTAAP